MTHHLVSWFKSRLGLHQPNSHQSYCVKSLACPGRAQRDPGSRAKIRELHSLSPLGPGSRSGYASASAGTRKICDAVQVTPPASLAEKARASLGHLHTHSASRVRWRELMLIHQFNFVSPRNCVST